MRRLPRNLGLDLVRVTEAAALEAARWMGLGRRVEAHRATAQAMAQAFQQLELQGEISVGEEARWGEATVLTTGMVVGTGNGPPADVVADPVDGTDLLVQGQFGAVAAVAVAPRGALWRPGPITHLEKIVVNREAAHLLVPECMDAPAPWTLALIARAKGKEIRDLTVFIVDRPWHRDLIEEVRSTGARVILRPAGDIEGGILAALPEGPVDLMIGVGSVVEGLLVAAAVRALRGGLLARPALPSPWEPEAVEKASLDPQQVFSCHDLVRSEEVFMAITGITDGVLLSGVRFRRQEAETASLVLRAETGTRRRIRTVHTTLR